MKALVAYAEWHPKQDYPLTQEEAAQQFALVGSSAWRNPEFQVRDVSEPRLSGHQVLVRVKACGICGSDTHLYETDPDQYIIFSGRTKFPCILGHEFSGVVEETGPLATRLQVGDRIAAESIMWCGVCPPCRTGALNQCRQINLMGLSADGALAEYAAIDEKYCWKIDSILEAYSEREAHEMGALIEPIGCAYNGMFVRAGGFPPGSIVSVFGLGPIGLAAVALANAAGASKIIAFDVIKERVDLATKMGAEHSMLIGGNSTVCPSETIMELTGGAGADVMVEAAGAAPLTIPEMERSLSAQGTIIYLGRAATGTFMSLNSLVSEAGRIVGARGHAGYGIFPNIVRLIASKRLNVLPMITSRYPLGLAFDALKKSAARTDGKILVTVS